MAIRILTLGGLRIVRDGEELDRLLSQRLRAALLVHLAVERRVSRESLLALFWPESSAANARHALRQGLYQLRAELGRGWVEALTHELVVDAGVETDVHAFVAALERDDAETAARIYGGVFLDGVHLVDLKGWESWVDARRAHYGRLFRRACTEWLAVRRAAHDLHGAIEAAQHWVRPDPTDDEAQHALIAALADAGLRADAIRQYEVYARHLEADDLRPLDHTVRLYERVLAAGRVSPEAGSTGNAAPPASTASTGSGAAPAATPPTATAPVPERGTADVPASPRRRLRRGRLLAASVTALAAAIVGAWALSARPERPAMPDDPVHAVAVLPFDVRGGDDAMFVADAMATLLGSALDGPTLRTVDPRAVRSLLPRTSRAYGVTHGRELARRVGAGMFIVGDVVQHGGTLHVDAAVYHTDAARPASRASAAAPADSLFEVVNRVAATLLAELSPGGSVLTRAAASTTSLPAFKAMLEGDAALRDGRFERAEDAYVRAVELDSAFGIAHYRLALARDWGASVTSPAAAARAALAHADRLSPRERSLLKALLAYQEGDAVEAERLYRAIVGRYPEDVEAWMQLGEVLFHLAPRHGRSLRDSEEAWRRVLAIEPRNEWALVHLARVAAADGRAGTIDSLLAGYGRDEIRSDRRLVQVRLLHAIAAGDSAAVADLVDAVREWEDAAVWQVLAYAAAYSADPAMAGVALGQFMSPQLGTALRADLERLAAILHAAGGRLSAAAERLERADRVHGRNTLPSLLHSWWYATLPLPHAEATLRAALQSALHARIAPAPTPAEHLWIALADETFGTVERIDALRAFVAGQLAIRLREPALADSMAARLDALASADTAALIRGFALELRARIAYERGDAAAALRLLENLPPDRASTGASNVVPFAALAGMRYLRGELLAAAGRHEEALGWYGTLGALSVPEAAYRPLAHLRLAELHALLGNRGAALDHDRRFNALWLDADPALQPLVAAAQRAADSLRSR